MYIEYQILSITDVLVCRFSKCSAPVFLSMALKDPSGFPHVEAFSLKSGRELGRDQGEGELLDLVGELAQLHPITKP